MNFASAIFWQHLGVCVLSAFFVLAILRRFQPTWVQPVGKIFLALTGIVLLVSESLVTLLSFTWVVLIGWAAVWVSSSRSRVFANFFVPLVLIQLAPLVYFKYWSFFITSVFGLRESMPSVLIPMGLSFYTFQTISFCLDSRREDFERPRFLDYWNFSSFFPQIVAGPIERRSHLLPQIENFKFSIHKLDIDPALRWIILGLFFKMALADNLGAIFNDLRINSENAYQVWLEAIVFSFRIYFDFAGYSLVALGLGRLFGIKLTLNFLSPYCSRDIKEFWRRWHVTLSSWLRDYVYIPLGGNRRGSWIVNIIMVFVVSGIWHGAGWGFIIWGGLHGIGVAAISLKKSWKLPRVIGILTTFVFVTFCWIFFYEREMDLMFGKALSICDFRNYGVNNMSGILGAFGGSSDVVLFLLITGLAGIVLLIEGWGSWQDEREGYVILKKTGPQVVQIFSIVFLAPMTQSGFIYFNF